MDSHELIDAQFDRAVEIVQGLPKTGPIQTSYEEKLTLYSLYKQATVGNVKSSRPGMFDMLGRAKWDAWAKHKDLNPLQAKWMYVDALMKVLTKYSDKTMARDLVRELESFGGDPSNLVQSSTLSRTPGSNSSGSTASNEHPSAIYQLQPGSGYPPGALHVDDEVVQSSEDEADDDEPPVPQDQAQRPQSTSSSQHRYRTPLATSRLQSPSSQLQQYGNVPSVQPLPGFQAVSAFADQQASPAPTATYRSTTSPQYPPRFSGTPQVAPGQQLYRAQPLVSSSYSASDPQRLERAVEAMQAHLAALQERCETLEAIHHQRNFSGGSSPRWHRSGGNTPAGRDDEQLWDYEHLGMWSLIAQPLGGAYGLLRQLVWFFVGNDQRGPTMLVVRRLTLDISFILCLLGVARLSWKKSGVRRREVNAALIVLWRAVMATKRPPVPRSVAERSSA